MLNYSDILKIKGEWVNPLDTNCGCHSLTYQEKELLKNGLAFINTFSFKLRESMKVTTPNGIEYDPRKDRLSIPIPERFKSVEHYLISLFHEYGHATGHHDRLGRASLYARGDQEMHSFEELIAELTAIKLYDLFKNTIWINSYHYIRTFIDDTLVWEHLLKLADIKAVNAIEYLLRG